MTEREASNKLIELLRGDSTFVSMLSTFSSGDVQVPMLVFSPLLPDSWKVTDKTVNIYTVSNASRYEYNRFRFRAACRSNSYSESRALGLALMDSVHRHCEDRFFVTTTVLQTVLPADGSVDNFNTPVEILVRAT